MVEPFIAGVTAILLTLFDLDRTFYVPARVKRKVTLYLWWWGFIVANGLIAGLIYQVIGETATLKSFPPVLRAIAIGMGYLAIIRLKFTTYNYHGTDIPVGFELIYEAAKNFVYKRINNIAKIARYDETIELANTYSLLELVNRARLSVAQDQLLKPEDKRTMMQWVLKVLQDANITDEAKRQALANYILSGQITYDLI